MSAPDDDSVRARLRARIRDVPDFPQPGVLFRDIAPLLADAQAFALAVDALGHDMGSVDAVAAIESRGFLLGAALAARLRVGLVPLRKPGKLPGETVTAAYTLEYGSDRLQMQRGAIAPGQRVLIVDDVLATGGTLGAAATLVRGAGALPVASVLIELDALGGRRRLPDLPIRSVLSL